MKTPLAWLNLIHQKKRTFVAVAGIAFAVLLVFMQLGFLGSVAASATSVYDHLDFDILLTSSRYVDFNKPGTFPRARLYQVQADPEVASASPLYVGFNLWRNPQTAQRRVILILGFRPSDPVFLLPEVADHAPELQSSDTLLFDRKSRKEFGPHEPGRTTQLGGRVVRVVGEFTLGSGFSSDGAVVTSDENFARLARVHSLDGVSLGLVKLRPGANPAAVAGEFNRLLAPAVRAVSRAEVTAREQRYWQSRTSVGVIFSLGVVVSLLVGLVFTYQVISSDLVSHLPEFATLKAMGYTEARLSLVVLQQSLFLAVLGYVPGLVCSLVLYGVMARAANLTLAMTVPRAVAVLGLALVMCACSGLLSSRKVRLADPADLF